MGKRARFQVLHLFFFPTREKQSARSVMPATRPALHQPLTQDDATDVDIVEVLLHQFSTIVSQPVLGA